MASSFDCLPPEIVQKCVEFLDFDLVSGDLKAVSKATRGVARRALTRGRWKPIRYVAQQALAAVSDIDHRVFFLEPPAAVCAPCREAWALDPALVISVICDWDTASINRERADAGVYQGRLLWIVEPSQDGLSRIVAALEGTCRIQFAPWQQRRRSWAFIPLPILLAWNYSSTLAAEFAEDPNIKVYEFAPGSFMNFEGFLGRELQHDEVGPLVGRGLGTWSDPKLAAIFTRQYLVRYGHGNDIDMHGTTAHVWSDDWEDRPKAREFVAELARIWNASVSLGEDEHSDY